MKIQVWRKLAVFFFAILWGVTLEAAYEDFVQFAKNKQGYKENAAILKILYEPFLGHLSPSNQRVLIAIGGSPGAGKTTFRKRFLGIKNAHVHDMDEVLVRIPEYQEDLVTMGAKFAFEKWWPTAREIAEIIVNYAIEMGYSIIYDRTCGAEGSYHDLLRAKERGYHIQIIGLYVDKEIARERILKREMEEGRMVTETILQEYRARFSALWPYYLDLADEATLYQTHLESPQLLFSLEKGIQDQQTYQIFLQEGEAFRDFFPKKIKKVCKEQPIKAIIFDCDGVLVDSEHFHYLAWQHTLQKYGYSLTLEEYYFYVGKSGPENAKLFAEKLGIDCAEDLLKCKRACFHQLQAKGIPAIQPTVDFVRLLAKEKKNLGLSMGVASSAKKEVILQHLRRHGIEECFDVILSGQDDLIEYDDPEGVNKPKPYIYLKAAKLLHAEPKKCVVIEDSRPGITAGVNAGCITIAIPNSFTKLQDLSHADVKIHSLEGMDVHHFFHMLAEKQCAHH